MIKIILVRHGESIANKKGIYQGQTYDTGLTLRGKKQAAMLVEPLRKIKINQIFTSPLQRTYQTGEVLSRRLGVPMTTSRQIIEISHGKWEGKDKVWVGEKYPELVKLWREKPTEVQMPEGENLGDVCLRVNSFLDELKKKFDKQTVIIVGHDLIMRVIVSLILRSTLDNIWQFRLDNGGLTILELESKSSGQILILNQNNHLNKYLSDVDSQAL